MNAVEIAKDELRIAMDALKFKLPIEERACFERLKALCEAVLDAHEIIQCNNLNYRLNLDADWLTKYTGEK